MAFHIAAESLTNMMPQPTDTASSISIPTWMRRRMSMRSARAPLYPASSRNGTQWEITANPPRAGEWNFSYITQ